jgi:hypothetical protein
MSHINLLTAQILTVFQAEIDNFTKIKPLPPSKGILARQGLARSHAQLQNTLPMRRQIL